MAENFNSHESAHEAKFSLDQETQFKVDSRRNKLLGLWLGERLGKTQSQLDEYAKEVVISDLEEPGDEDVIRKLLGDLTAAECDVSEADIRTKLEECSVEARRQFMSDQG